ncbi:hypothetical protein A4D02_14105 [Niastella koreensis]|nr:hypothetical protein A4D02_14105 [Niastella koreensis]
MTLLAICNGFSQDSTTSKTILFICEHGSFRSVVAAAAFNKMAKEQGLNIRAIARGTVPNKEVNPIVLSGLKQDGFSEITPVPQKISNEELGKASYVVTFCALPGDFHRPVSSEDWSTIPLVDGDYSGFRDSVLPRVRLLIGNLKKRP